MTMDSVAFSDEFINDAIHKTRWNSFLKKKKALISVSINDVMAWIKVFAQPLLIETIIPGESWDPNEGYWK